jgi:hypothetical protein
VAHVLTSPSVGIHGKLPVGKSAQPTICTELDAQALDFTHDLKASKHLSGTQDLSYPHGSVMLMTANFSNEALTLPKGTTLGVAQETSENLVVSVSDEECTDEYAEQTFFSGSNKEVSKKFKKYIDEMLAHLSEADRKIKTSFN